MAFRRRRHEADGPWPPSTEPLNDGEMKWRAEQVEIARILTERYAGDTEALPSLEGLELVISGWLDDDARRVAINQVVNGVGIAFGERLAARAHLEWVIATDARGSDLALLGQAGDVLIFPANAIAKRLAAGESGFVRSLFDAMVDSIDERRTT